jgi:flagellar L-ring protein precursor FlgH
MRFTLTALTFLAACSTTPIGAPPPFTQPQYNSERDAMINPGLPAVIPVGQLGPSSHASLWAGDRNRLTGDSRARQRGDILTVLISIDDSATMTNSTNRTRTASQRSGVPQLAGIPQRVAESLPEGASIAPLVDLNGQSNASGSGTVRRREQMTLRVAVTVTDVLPNGMLAIAGQQEVRVNFELRELQVSGFVRPEDISRQNMITSDKIASARISYGGRGQVTDMQQPRYGQQVLERVLPF